MLIKATSCFSISENAAARSQPCVSHTNSLLHVLPPLFIHSLCSCLISPASVTELCACVRSAAAVSERGGAVNYLEARCWLLGSSHVHTSTTVKLHINTMLCRLDGGQDNRLNFVSNPACFVIMLPFTSCWESEYQTTVCLYTCQWLVYIITLSHFYGHNFRRCLCGHSVSYNIGQKLLNWGISCFRCWHKLSAGVAEEVCCAL